MNKFFLSLLLLFSYSLQSLSAQYQPKSWTSKQIKDANIWVDKTYESLSQDEKLGQLFIVALYTNKGEEYIQTVRNLVKNEQLGGLILMQDDAESSAIGESRVGCG